MAFDFNIYILIQIGLGILAFIIIVRFLFSMSTKESQYKRSQEQIKTEIDKLKKDLGKIKHEIPGKEFGELMDDLMEEYYTAEQKRELEKINQGFQSGAKMPPR